MIDKQKVEAFIKDQLKPSHFIVDISVGAANQIQIIIDGMQSVSIDDCVSYTKAFEMAFDRDTEDYELSVSSGGLDLSFTVEKQYLKNLNKDVDIVYKDGKKQTAKLIAYKAGEIEIEYQEMVLQEGKKRKTAVNQHRQINIDAEVKSIKPSFSFKKK